MSVKAAFLDRDGVINIDHGYAYRPEEFQIIEGVFEACRALVNANYRLVVVTNQSGIGRGYYTEADFAGLTEWMKDAFANEGAPISAVYFCPHHPEKAQGHYRMVCDCRKPAPGMLLQAQKDLDIDMAQSVMFGDKPGDMKAALAAGVTTRILLGQDGNAVPEAINECTDVAKDLLSGVNTLLRINP